MLSRVLVALGLSAALVAGAALALLRTDFVSDNLCAYAVATIEEASSAHVRVAACRVNPGMGELTIDGLEVGDRGERLHLTVARVFVQVTVRPLLQRLRLERLEIDHADLRLALNQAPEGPPAPASASKQCLPDALDRFELGRVTLRKARVQVEMASGARLSLPRASAELDGRNDTLHLSARLRDGELGFPGRRTRLERARLRAQVDLRGAGAIVVDEAQVQTPELALVMAGDLKGLCAPRIEAGLEAQIPDLSLLRRFFPEVPNDLRGSAAVTAHLGFGDGPLRSRGEVRTDGLFLGGVSPGDARFRYELAPQRLLLEEIRIAIGARGEVAGRAELGLAGAGLPLAADLQLRGVELAELLQKFGLAHSHVVLRTGGRVQARGTLAPLRLAGEVGLDLEDFAVLDRRFEQRSRAERAVAFARGRLETAVSVDGEQVEVHGAELQIEGSHLRVDGALRFDARQGLDLAVRGQDFALEDLRGRIGGIPWSGRTAIEASVRGPYGDPTIASSAQVRGFHFAGLSLGDVSAELGFHGLLLELDDLQGKKGGTRYAGDVSLDFSGEKVLLDGRADLLEGRIHDLVDAGLDLVPALAPLRDAADVDGSLHGSLEAKGPAEGPDGTARLELSDLQLWGERFSSGDVLLLLHGKEPRLQIERLALRRGEAQLTAAGRFGPAWELAIDARSDGFDLRDLDPARAAHLSGPLEANARVRGVASRPRADVRLAVRQARAGNAFLGEGAFELHLDGPALFLRGNLGTHTVEGRGELEGDFPYGATLALRFPDVSGYVSTFLPEWDLSGGSVVADVSLHGSLLELGRSEGLLSLKELKIAREGLLVENDGPAQLEFGPEGLAVTGLSLRAPYTTATLQGVARRAKLGVRIAAHIDGRVLQGLIPDVEHASGQYLLQATLSGTAAAPSLLGNLRVEDAEVRLRGVPLSFREMNGSVSFSQDALVIDGMMGKVNNGVAKVSGGLELKKLVPRRVDLAVRMNDVVARLREDLTATLDGDLTLFGPPLEPTLGGNLEISRLRYASDLDLERSLLDFSRGPAAPRVLEKSTALVHFDLGLHLGSGVRIENNLARADLKGDLQVTGTSRRLGLLGSLNSVRGTAQFRGNEFQIEQGILTFTDRQGIRPSFDLQAATQVKEYKVRLHAFGTPAQPRLTLQSEPALAEADVGFLLTFGFVSQNLQQSSFSATDSGLALGVEALSKVTGFSEQVRRFIPKNAILKDPSIDFTSDFSVATSRLEPMARFRSHFVSDRLDLKVLDGLSTRRYRGVLSYQLSDALSGQLQLDNEHIDTGTDFGVDLKLRLEAGE